MKKKKYFLRKKKNIDRQVNTLLYLLNVVNIESIDKEFISNVMNRVTCTDSLIQ